MQHLVGAKLDCVLGADTIEHHGFSTSDSASNRSGDFHVGDVAIHVTTAPTEALIAKCKANIGDGIRPIIQAHRQGDADLAFALYQRWLPLINHENRQGGILTAKALMKEGGVITCEAGRHPFPAMHPEVRRGLIDIARRLDPLVLRWAR